MSADRRFALLKHTHDFSGFVTKEAIDALNIDADTVDGQHASAFAAASHTHTESDITDGSIFARVASNEGISGAWTFQGGITIDRADSANNYIQGGGQNSDNFALIFGADYDSSLNPIIRGFGATSSTNPKQIQYTTPPGGDHQFFGDVWIKPSITEGNVASVLKIGQNTLQGSNANGQIFLFGEEGGTVFGSVFNQTSGNLQISGTTSDGATAASAIQVSLLLDILSGNAFRVRDATNADMAVFSHDGTNFNTSFLNTTSWNITGANVVFGDSVTFNNGADSHNFLRGGGQNSDDFAILFGNSYSSVNPIIRGFGGTAPSSAGLLSYQVPTGGSHRFSGGDVQLSEDNQELQFGVGTDLRIFSDGSGGNITTPNGSLTLSSKSSVNSVVIRGNDGDGGSLKIQERAAAAPDAGGYGQIWVKNTTPCELWFTDDSGNDGQIPTMIVSTAAASGAAPDGKIWLQV